MPLTNDNSLDYWGNGTPKCPFCDKDIDISEHDMYCLYEEDDHDIDCPYCEKTFIVISSCKWTFDTNKQAREDTASTSSRDYLSLVRGS